MTVALFVLVIVAVVAGVGQIAVAEWQRRHQPEPEPEPEVERLISERRAIRVVVTQTDGESFVGLIADWDTGWLLLREVESLGPQGSRIGVDGELLLPRDRVAYIQRP